MIAAGDVARLWHTVRHLRPVQVYGRLWFRLAQPRTDLSPAPTLRKQVGKWRAPARRNASLIGSDRFWFLNEAGSLTELSWDNPAKSKLWRYNQHYFDDLNARAAEARCQWHQSLINNWITSNSPGQGLGWDPYPTSLRIVNWIKWSLAGNSLSEQATNSLAIQCRWLMRRLEWHLLGNHLFANAKALVFGGLFFGDPDADNWLRSGIHILQREVPEQILADGGQFELSPMYHAICVEDMLDLVNVARTYGRDDLANAWGELIPGMLNWLETMSHPDGDLAFFNDTAIGIAPSNAEILAYADRLGFHSCPPRDRLHYLPKSGYARLSHGDAVLIADLAPIGPDYLPGHAHADTLSFELSLCGQRVIVNSGTSVYGTGPERLRQRGTAAHSTLVTDGLDSSEVWSGFRVGRRARTFDVEVTDDGEALVAQASHDGYRHLRGSPVHRRTWRLVDGQLTVLDTIEGKGKHRAEAFFHLAPGFQATVTAKDLIEVRGVNGSPFLKVFIGNGTADVIPSSWHPQFGMSIPNEAIRITQDATLPYELCTRFTWSLV